VTFTGPAARPIALGEYPEFDVIVRSRVSVDRNLEGHRFPHALDGEAIAELGAGLSAAARSRRFEVARIGDLDPWSRSNLAERELYSRPYLLDEENYAALSPDSALWLAVNDVNHLSFRASRPGLDLRAAWADVSEADDSISVALGSSVWAFDPGIGYAMSEIAFCGSGLSARVSIHAPSLVVSGLAEIAFKRAMEAGFVVSGAYSGMGASEGSLFELSLPPVYRDPELVALERLEGAARAIADYERRARNQLLSGSSWDILDVIGRAAGRAIGARLVSRDEAADICSGLRLGLACGALEGMRLETVTDLWPSLRIRPSVARVREGEAAPKRSADTRMESTTDEPEAAMRARALRRAAVGLRFSQGYMDV
jgi:protein arginine kinase